MSTRTSRELRLVVNGEACALPPTSTVEDLVRRLGIEPRGVAVAVDGEVVPRSAWSKALLADGARVEVVGAAAGG